MYEIDGIVYAGELTPAKKVIHAEYMGGHVLRIAFNTGEVVDVDFSKGFDGPAMEPLKDQETLRQFDLQFGMLTWLDGGIDVAPEYYLEVGTMIEGAITA